MVLLLAPAQQQVALKQPILCTQLLILFYHAVEADGARPQQLAGDAPALVVPFACANAPRSAAYARSLDVANFPGYMRTLCLAVAAAATVAADHRHAPR